MTATIITEGGIGIGFGHVTRCLALYEAFEERGIISELIINGDDSILPLLEDAKYRVFNWLKQKDDLLKTARMSDIIVIDSYLADKSLYNKISNESWGRFLIMIDDCKRIEYPHGIVINPSIYGERLDYPKTEGVGNLLGKDYIILRSGFWNLPGKVVNKEIREVLITFGGMDYTDLIHKITGYFKDGFDFTFSKIDSREMLDSMLKADLCISGGGQTIHELARVGVPIIGICLSENQRMNLESWHKKGVVEYAGRHNDLNLMENIKTGIEKLSSQESRSKVSNRGRALVDGQGARRVVSKILS